MRYISIQHGRYQIESFVYSTSVLNGLSVILANIFVSIILKFFASKHAWHKDLLVKLWILVLNCKVSIKISHSVMRYDQAKRCWPSTCIYNIHGTQKTGITNDSRHLCEIDWAVFTTHTRNERWWSAFLIREVLIRSVACLEFDAYCPPSGVLAARAPLMVSVFPQVNQCSVMRSVFLEQTWPLQDEVRIACKALLEIARCMPNKNENTTVMCSCLNNFRNIWQKSRIKGNKTVIWG